MRKRSDARGIPWKQAFHDSANSLNGCVLGSSHLNALSSLATSTLPGVDPRCCELHLPTRDLAMGTDTRHAFDFSARIEQLEDRLLMSADPVGGLLGGAIEHHAIAEQPPALEHHLQSTPDFWIDRSDQELLEEHLWEIDQALANAHDQTGMSGVRTDFGFSGLGQTVAVIDSGIAYDHFALGGGFGQNYRVVGGWDFSGENDANPYDDGPEGSHGTHVSGIIGSSDSTHAGVAPGVDLVGLRVFDDAGAGYFSWVENALQWVHANRNNFDNPITAVNLSLGVSSWNSDTIPSWAQLEDEFAQLEADGIFIAVSAGNSFTSYNEPGLSYPAASSYVVPVMSVDDNGNLSYFSQRHTRAIAAPGRTIVSTVPDYVGNGNNIADDFASFSGTSMAAPYVAGASVIIREAMEFVGYTNITQDMIYDHMMATADLFFDSATNQNYSRLNMDAAIGALMPTDDYGSSVAAAHDLGSITDTASISGVIGTLNDADYFTFTAGNTGTVTFEASNMTHELEAAWIGTGQVSGSSNETYMIDVVAGQSYTVGFVSTAGLGYYDFDITAESSFTFTDWGAIAFTQLENLSVAGESWYRVEASTAGYMTVESLFDTGGGAISLDLYSDEMQLIDSGTANNGTSRVQSYAAAGDEFYVCVLGTNSEVDFRLSNLVSISGTTVQVDGTVGDDLFGFTAGSNHVVTVNGVSHSFAANSITDVSFDGGAGSDSIVMTGTAENETATLRVGDFVLSGEGYSSTVAKVEQVTILGGGGEDLAFIFDSAGDDIFSISPNTASMTGAGFHHVVDEFEKIYGYASAGNDIARLYDSASDDTLDVRPNQAWMYGSGFYNYAGNFDQIYAYASSGNDAARLYDSASDDTLDVRPNQAWMYGSGFYNYAGNFDRIYAYASGGNDAARLYDSASDDTLDVRPNQAWMYGSGFYNYAGNFDRIYAYASGGNDAARLYDSASDDTLDVRPNQAWMYGSGFYNYAGNFDRIYAYASGGNDAARLYDSANNDTLVVRPNRAWLFGSGFYNYAGSFDRIYAYASGGDDAAWLYDSAGDDTLDVRPNQAWMYGSGFYNYARDFERVYSYASQGHDRAYLRDSLGDDIFMSDGSHASLAGSGYFNYTSGFDESRAYSSGGIDRADFFDILEGDLVQGTGNFAEAVRSASAESVFGFDYVTAHTETEESVEIDLGAIDYIFTRVGLS